MVYLDSYELETNIDEINACFVGDAEEWIDDLNDAISEINQSTLKLGDIILTTKVSFHETMRCEVDLLISDYDKVEIIKKEKDLQQQIYDWECRFIQDFANELPKVPFCQVPNAYLTYHDGHYFVQIRASQKELELDYITLGVKDVDVQPEEWEYM